jgi:hypothetical protein
MHYTTVLTSFGRKGPINSLNPVNGSLKLIRGSNNTLTAVTVAVRQFLQFLDCAPDWQLVDLIAR